MQSDQAKLTALEREIEQATDRLQKAKLAFREAKALVKVARKARKQLRRELGRLQDEAGGEDGGKSSTSSSAIRASARKLPELTVKVADSPERPRKPRKKNSRPAPAASVTAIPVESPAQEAGAVQEPEAR